MHNYKKFIVINMPWLYRRKFTKNKLMYLLSLLESEGGDGGAGISVGGDGAAVNAGILGGSSGGAGSGGKSGGVDALGAALAKLDL